MPLEHPLPQICGRLMLRTLHTTDLPAFQRYRHDPEVGRYQGWGPVTDAEALAFLEQMNAASPFNPGDWYQLGIAELGSNLLIGDIGVHVAADQGEAEIGFSLSQDAQGRGLGTEAVSKAIRLVFEIRPIGRVVGITNTRNLPSIRLLERVGMTRTDTLTSVFRGAPCTEYVYTMTRPHIA